MITINCVLESNDSKWLKEMQKVVEESLGIKFENKKCCCKCANKKKKTNEFDNVKKIDHII